MFNNILSDIEGRDPNEKEDCEAYYNNTEYLISYNIMNLRVLSFMNKTMAGTSSVQLLEIVNYSDESSI
ncbi:hypothetical protein H5410_044391 [Solanum commersonii]|uniref:Uncharacterized protein n=1 Tax=Solanum commersonii TaxID=4109 RepID=A0A9J5X8X5_SOLCO|nr:hypothetical protein H5410_044391 [Solanum commersonii]